MKIFRRFAFQMPLLTSSSLIILVALTNCGPSEAERKAKEESARVAAKEAATIKLQYNMIRLMPYIDPHMDEYLSLPAKPRPGQAYLRGKIVPVSVKGKLIHRLYLDLPDALRAINPDEIGTVLLLSCTRKSVGFYSGRGGGAGGASTETCEMKIVDTTIPEVVGTETFNSPNPPAYIENRFGGDMEVKSSTIIEYLLALPRK